RFPAILKPNQGGSGARMFKVETLAGLEDLLAAQPDLWLPDNLLLLQEYLPHDARGTGIVRMEFLGGELLYAMRVTSDGSRTASRPCPRRTAGSRRSPASASRSTRRSPWVRGSGRSRSPTARPWATTTPATPSPRAISWRRAATATRCSPAAAARHATRWRPC